MWKATLLVVSPNLALNKILDVDGFRIGDVQRSRSLFSQPGAKGSNVARGFRQLGGDVVLAGFVGERNGSWVVDPLNAIGANVEAIEAYPGESRTCRVLKPTVYNVSSLDRNSCETCGLNNPHVEFATLLNWKVFRPAGTPTGTDSAGTLL